MWQVAWFLVGLALYLESGRNTHQPNSANEAVLRTTGGPTQDLYRDEDRATIGYRGWPSLLSQRR